MDFDYYIRGGGRIRGPFTWNEVADEVKPGFEAAKVPSGTKPRSSDFALAGPLLSAVSKQRPSSEEMIAFATSTMPSSEVRAHDHSSPAFAFLLYGLAVVLAIVSFLVAYRSSNYASGIVGGDAFNYIIFAGRGAVWGLASVVCAVIGSGSHIAHSVNLLRSRAV